MDTITQVKQAEAENANAKDQVLVELADLQLALIGGGCISVVFG